jgi:protein O-GlcNAc transferase
MADRSTTDGLLVRIPQLMQQGSWDEAEAATRELLSLAPQEAQAWFFAGLVAFSRRQIADAEAALRKAIALNAQPAIYWNLLGAALRQQFRWEETAEASRQSLARDEGDSVAWSNLAAAELMLGHLASAQEAYERCLQIAPDRADAACEYALVLTKRGYPSEAVTLLEGLLSRDPQMTAAWIGMGHALAQADKLKEAATAFRRALELAPGERNARHHLAVILMQQWSLTDAEALVREIIRDDPYPAEAWSMLGTIFRMQGRIDEALDALRRAVVLEPHADRHSRLLVTMQYAADASPQSLLVAHREWDVTYAQPVPPAPVPARGGREGDRLRLGFV